MDQYTYDKTEIRSAVDKMRYAIVKAVRLPISLVFEIPFSMQTILMIYRFAVYCCCQFQEILAMACWNVTTKGAPSDLEELINTTSTRVEEMLSHVHDFVSMSQVKITSGAGSISVKTQKCATTDMCDNIVPSGSLSLICSRSLVNLTVWRERVWYYGYRTCNPRKYSL